MSDQVRSILIGTAGVATAAAVALGLTVARGPVLASPAALRATVRLAGVAFLFQAAHFGEELATGFAHRFPEVFGLAPWSARFFVGFNLTWFALWALSLPGLAARYRPALFPLWFLSLGGILNGVAHPVLALVAGGYFPGVATAPLVGLAGGLLVWRLLRITEGRRAPAAVAE